MKRMNYLMTAILCFGLVACADGQIRKTVTGDGNVVKKTRTAEACSGVRVSTGIDVYLSQGSKPSLEVEADENLHEYIVTEYKDGVLHVYTDANIRSADSKKVYVTMPEVSSVSTSSAGDVIGVTPVKTDNLKLNSSSAGDIKLEVTAKSVDANASSSGDITLSGVSDMLDATLSSAGNLNAFDLKVREAEVSASSAGDADVFVTERLTARASSAGDINYKGDPKYIDAHSSSAGGVHRK